MSESSILDFEALLAPISDERPCGTSRDDGDNVVLTNAFSELYHLGLISRKIEENRLILATLAPTERDDRLRDYEGTSDGPQADPKWRRIADLAIEILEKHSKDTRVMRYLIEAMPRIDGMAGMRDAFLVSAQMVDKYRLDLFPAPEPGEPANSCLEPLGQINGSKNLEGFIDQAEIFPDRLGYSWFFHSAAKELTSLSSSEREQRTQNGQLTIEDFEREVNRANVSELQMFAQSIEDLLNAANQFDKILTDLSNKQFGIGSLIDRMNGLRRWFSGLASDRLAASAGSSEAASATGLATSPNADVATEGRVLVHAGEVVHTTREQALNQLLQVAAYFRKTEPHSPLSYALEQAVRWGRMPLPDLLQELLQDKDVLSSVYQRMGIREKNNENDD